MINVYNMNIIETNIIDQVYNYEDWTSDKRDETIIGLYNFAIYVNIEYLNNYAIYNISRNRLNNIQNIYFIYIVCQKIS